MGMVRVVNVRIGKRKAYQTGNGVVMSLTNFVESGKRYLVTEITTDDKEKHILITENKDVSLRNHNSVAITPGKNHLNYVQYGEMLDNLNASKDNVKLESIEAV